MQVDVTFVAAAGSSSKWLLYWTVKVSRSPDKQCAPHARARPLLSEDIAAVQSYHIGMADAGHIELTGTRCLAAQSTSTGPLWVMWEAAWGEVRHRSGSVEAFYTV